MFSAIRNRGLHMSGFVFGLALIVMGCSDLQKQTAIEAYRKVAGPTTRAVESAAELAAKIPPGTPISEYSNLVLVASGAILALDKVVVTVLSNLPSNKRKKKTADSAAS